MAIPGIYPQSKPLTAAHKENMVLGQDNGLQIHIDNEKIRLGSADASEALVIASKVKDELKKIQAAFNGHIHGFVPPAGPNPAMILASTSTITSIEDIATERVVAK